MDAPACEISPQSAKKKSRLEGNDFDDSLDLSVLNNLERKNAGKGAENTEENLPKVAATQDFDDTWSVSHATVDTVNHGETANQPAGGDRDLSDIFNADTLVESMDVGETVGKHAATESAVSNFIKYGLESPDYKSPVTGRVKKLL